MALLIVNADDFGLTPGVCRAIRDGHRHGVVTETSMLAVAPAFDLAVAMATSGDCDGLGIGAHLAVVGEDPPLLSAREVPSLVDRRGHFWSSWREFLPRATAGRIDRDDLRREFAAQLERLRGSGIALSHVDTHQHLHLWPLVREVVLDLAVAAGIGAIRVPHSGNRGPRGRYVARLSRRLAVAADERGVRHTDSFAGLDEAGHATAPVLAGMVGHLSHLGAGSAEIGCHPGDAADPERRRYAWGFDWPGELDALCAPATRQAITAAGFELGRFADLAPAP